MVGTQGRREGRDDRRVVENITGLIGKAGRIGHGGSARR